MVKEELKLSTIEIASQQLIINDLRYIQTVLENKKYLKSNYIVSMMPFFGLIIDGVEKWIDAIYKTRDINKVIPLFNEEEADFYSILRNSTKMWDTDYDKAFNELQSIYMKSDSYFSSLCKPIAKTLKLYDIYGIDLVNNHICGNTILCYFYTPYFSFGGNNDDLIRKMTIIAGTYVGLFDAAEPFKVDKTIEFKYEDIGGLKKSKLGNAFNDKFVIFSLLCQINFVLYCVNDWINEEISTKLRFAYLIYYYSIDFVKITNEKNATSFIIDNKLKSREFRNAMAHYKLGVCFKDGIIKENDYFYGLTNKILGLDYKTTKNFIVEELRKLSNQLTEYLGLEKDKLCID